LERVSGCSDHMWTFLLWRRVQPKGRPPSVYSKGQLDAINLELCVIRDDNRVRFTFDPKAHAALLEVDHGLLGPSYPSGCLGFLHLGNHLLFYDCLRGVLGSTGCVGANEEQRPHF